MDKPIIAQYPLFDLPPKVKPKRKRVNYIYKDVDGVRYFLWKPHDWHTSLVGDDLVPQTEDFGPIWIPMAERGRKLPRFYAHYFSAERVAKRVGGVVGVWQD